jgi:hypothetical protein
MSTRKRKQIEDRIQTIKQRLLTLGQMRPGSLSRQYKRPHEKAGAYYQVSYTHKMRSRTEYVRPEFVRDIRTQIAVYKRFRKLIDTWVELAIEQSRLTMHPAKTSKAKGKDEKASRLRR